MKLRSFLLAALVACGFAACSDNGENPDVGNEPGTETYATFSVSLLKSNARAFLGDTSPTAEEKTVDQLTVYIYDEYTGKIEEVLSFADENESQTAQITVGTKQVLVTSGIAPVFTKGSSVDWQNEVINVVDETFFQTNLIQNNKFWMTGSESCTFISATEEEAKTDGHENNVKISIGRAVAKIGVYYDVDIVVKDATETTDLGALSDVKYRVKNQPNKMYLFTDYDNASGVWRTPYFNRNSNLWDDSHKADYWYQANWYKTGLVSNNHEEPSYMMENSNQIARYGNATYIALEGTFTPEVWLNADGSVGAAQATGSSFWRIALLDDSQNIIGWKSDDCYLATPDLTQYDPASNEGAVEYVNGVVYYWLYLNKTLIAGNEVGSTPDKYSQRRNEYWDVQVTKVTGIGWSDEDGGKPEDPRPLDSETYIHATIQIADWVPVSMPGAIVGN